MMMMQAERVQVLQAMVSHWYAAVHTIQSAQMEEQASCVSLTDVMERKRHWGFLSSTNTHLDLLPEGSQQENQTLLLETAEYRLPVFEYSGPSACGHQQAWAEFTHFSQQA